MVTIPSRCFKATTTSRDERNQARACKQAELRGYFCSSTLTFVCSGPESVLAVCY